MKSILHSRVFHSVSVSMNELWHSGENTNSQSFHSALSFSQVRELLCLPTYNFHRWYDFRVTNILSFKIDIYVCCCVPCSPWIWNEIGFHKWAYKNVALVLCKKWLMIVNKDGESWGNLCGWFGNAQGTGCQPCVLTTQHPEGRKDIWFCPWFIAAESLFFLSIGVYLSQLKQRFTADAFLFLISFLDVACFLFFSL